MLQNDFKDGVIMNIEAMDTTGNLVRHIALRYKSMILIFV